MTLATILGTHCRSRNTPFVDKKNRCTNFTLEYTTLGTAEADTVIVSHRNETSFILYKRSMLMLLRRFIYQLWDADVMAAVIRNSSSLMRVAQGSWLPTPLPATEKCSGEH